MLPETPVLWPCPPVLALHPHIWDLSLEGVPLWGAQKLLDIHSLQASLPKPPPQLLHACGCTVKTQDAAQDLGAALAQVLYPNMSSPQAPLPASCPESQLVKDGTSVCLSSIPLSIPAPGFYLLPLVSLCHRVPFCGRLRSCPCPGGMTQPLLCYGCVGFAWPNALPDPPNPAFWVLLASCCSLAVSDSPSYHTSLLSRHGLISGVQIPSSTCLRSLDIAGSSWT